MQAHRVEVGEEAERRRAVESEGQQVLEVQLRLQRPSRDGQGSQEGAALGRRTCTTGGSKCQMRRNIGEVQGLQGALLRSSEEARIASIQDFFVVITQVLQMQISTCKV